MDFLSCVKSFRGVMHQRFSLLSFILCISIHIASSGASTCTNKTDGLLTCGHFDHSFCFGQGWSTGQVRWQRSTVIKTSSGKEIVSRNMMPGSNGINKEYFIYQDATDSEFVTGSKSDFDVDLTQLHDDVTAVCVTFYFASVTDDVQHQTVPSVVLSLGGEPSREIGRLEQDTHGSWIQHSFEACLGKHSYFLSISSTKQSNNTFVAFDDVTVTHSNILC